MGTAPAPLQEPRPESALSLFILIRAARLLPNLCAHREAREAFDELRGPGFDRESRRLCAIGRLRHIHTRRRWRLLLHFLLVIFVYLQEWVGSDAFPFRWRLAQGRRFVNVLRRRLLFW